ncbi:MAG: DNA translocase FtsK 4TM domain-containing protein, partial [Thermodesulfobacteriota bacterium]
MSRKKQRAARAPAKESKGGIKQEVFGIVLLALAVYVGLCLYSRNEPANWGGMVGDMLSWGLKTSIGYASYTFPFFLALLSLRFLFRRVFKVSAIAPLGFIIFIPALAGLARILFLDPGSGGVVGDLLGHILSDYIGFGGALIALVAAVLISLLAITGMSFIQVALNGFKALGALICLLEERFKKRRSERAGQKAVRLKEKATRLKEEKARKVEELKARDALDKKEAEAELKALAEAEPAIITGEPPVEAAVEKPEAAAPAEEPLKFNVPAGVFKLPGPELLDEAAEGGDDVDRETLLQQS